MRARPLGGEGLDSLEDGGGLHEHALTAAEGRVVDRAVAVMGPVAQVVRGKVEDAGPLGPAHDGGVQVGSKDLRKDGERLEPHLPAPPW